MSTLPPGASWVAHDKRGGRAAARRLRQIAARGQAICVVCDEIVPLLQVQPRLDQPLCRPCYGASGLNDDKRLVTQLAKDLTQFDQDTVNVDTPAAVVDDASDAPAVAPRDAGGTDDVLDRDAGVEPDAPPSVP